jgi:hypothetical protein
MWNHCVLKDEEAETDRRYKLLCWARPEDRSPGIHAAFSPDGIHWSPYEKNPVIGQAATGDTFSVMRDPASGRYWLYHKTPGQPIRCISRMVSDNFLQWDETRRVLAPDLFDPPDTEFYGLSAFPRGSQYLGFLWVYHTYTQTMDVQLVSSRDGLNWDRTADRKRFMHRLPTNSYRGGAFDTMMIFPASAPIAKDGGFWLFYSGFTVPHNAPAADHEGRIGLATTRLDGFCSLDATSPGYVLTRPFTWNGSRLRLNAVRYGPAKSNPPGIRVQIEDHEEGPIPGLEAEDCTPIRGDETETIVQWKDRNDLSDLSGRTVQLRFEIQFARLYSWRME